MFPHLGERSIVYRMSVYNTIITPVANNDFPGRIVRRSMGNKSNIKELEALKKAAPKENKDMIQTLIELSGIGK